MILIICFFAGQENEDSTVNIITPSGWKISLTYFGIGTNLDYKFYKKKKCLILLSPAAASFDQFKNFEIRGNKFKKLCKKYARKFI